MDNAAESVTHCPINADGHKVKAHIFQQNLADNAYVADIYVGNPPQPIKALFDTGSTNTWILNADTPLPGNAHKERAFHTQASQTFTPTSQKAKIFFGSGDLSGNFVTDTMRLGTCDGQSSGQVVIKDQKFGNVLQQKTIFTGSNFEAIIGMAYPALAEPGVRPVFDEMMAQNLLESNMFAFFLSSQQDEAQGRKSDLTFGYYDKTKFKGDIHWNDIKLKYMFGVKLDDIKVNGVSTGVCADRPQGCLITFDSGTSLQSMPKFAIKKFKHLGLPTATNLVQCQSKNDFGDLTFVINGVDYPLSADEWMFDPKPLSLAQGGMKTTFSMGPLGPQIFAQLNGPAPESNVQLEADSERKHHASAEVNAQMKQQMCGSTLMEMEIKESMFLVGDIFMRRYYTIFDRDNDRVGLAPSVNGAGHTMSAQKSSSSDDDDLDLAQKKNAKK